MTTKPYVIRATHHVLYIADLIVVVGLAALVVVGTLAYYYTAYRPAVLASDRIRGVFQGFYEAEGTRPRIYRWTNGNGTLCLPAAGQQRPPLGLQLDLLGQEPKVDVTAFGVQVGTERWYLPLLAKDRRYTLLVPPGPEHGPVCVILASSTAQPVGDGRSLGVGVRAVTLWRLDRGAPPPLSQLGLNLAIALGGYWLLRRIGSSLAPTAAALAGLVAAFTVGLLTGNLRVTPDLPLWSVGAAAAISGMLVIDLLHRGPLARLQQPWRREIAGVALTTLILGVAWAAMASLEGYLWPFPLMARPGPVALEQLPYLFLPLALFAGWLALILYGLRAADNERPTNGALKDRFRLHPGSRTFRPWFFVLLCYLAAVLLPVALKVSLRGWESLFQTFTWQPEDYIRDVPRVGNDPLGFLRSYVQQMPDLALHNRNHPPGSTLLLWAVHRLIGPGPEIATWVAIGLAGLGVWPTYRLAARVGGAQVGLAAAALYVVLPAQLIYATTSMNAVYTTILAFAIDALYAALTTEFRPWRAVVAGCWLALGLCFFFGTLMLGLFALAVFWWRIRAPGTRNQEPGTGSQVSVLVQGLIVCGTTALLLGLLYAATGYNSIAALFQGIANNNDEVQQRLPPPGPATYLFFMAANSIAYACFLGPWVLNRVVGSGRRGLAALARQRATPADALHGGLALLLLGMLLSGLFTREVERIWSFTHILVACTVANGMIQHRDRPGIIPFMALMSGILFIQATLFRILMRFYW